MKKILLLIVALGLFGTLRAQYDITFGPKVGMNLSNVSGWSGDNKAGILLGAFAETRLDDLIGVQAELIYSRQGLRDKFDGVKYWGRLNYLNVPILAKIYVLDNVSVDLGPQIGILWNGKDKWKTGGTTTKRKMYGLNTFEVSFAVGASYEFDMGVIVSARYNVGLTNVRDKDFVSEMHGRGSNKNRVFQLSLAYRLDM